MSSRNSNVPSWLFSLLIYSHLIPLNYSYCENDCSGHGICTDNDLCRCFVGSDGTPLWITGDCSLRTCPRGLAWISTEAVRANDVHPLIECSNKGICDREHGECTCFPGYEGIACERSSCPNECSGRGVCYTQKQLADEASRVYRSPWDANKITGCFCDFGFRGPDCSLVECPSGADIMKGHGAEQGRDCSGRGICDYTSGRCQCFTGYSGIQCQNQAILM